MFNLFKICPVLCQGKKEIAAIILYKFITLLFIYTVQNDFFMKLLHKLHNYFKVT